MSDELILVIDDGKDNRDFLIEYVLEPNSFRHLVARDGEEGLQLALKHKPDLILLDLQMPRMNGLQVLKALDQNQFDVPVILMTFHGSEEIAIEVYRLGVRDYVKKPYYPDEMLEAIEGALTETRLRREKDALTNRVLQANQELQRRLHEFEILSQVGKAVTSTMVIDELLPQIVDAAVTITDAEEGFITLIEDQQLVRRAHKPVRLEKAQAIAQSIHDSIAMHVLQKKQLVLLGPDRLQRAANGGSAPRSVVYVPITLGKRILGTLSVLNHSHQSHIFNKQDTALLNALSDYAAIAIENSHNYDALQQSKEKMRDTFERFVPPSVVQRALSEDVELGGHRQEITVLFADIRGYTAWSENTAPEKVVEVLNHYLNVAAGVVIGWEGTLDKFFGDGLMAIFNAPNPQDDHVHRATEVALAIMEAAHEINQHYGYNLSYSIGVHVGEAVVGYIGTNYAVNYTAIGDTVNLAKRLQEAAAPGQILLDEAVVKRLNGQIKAQAMGELQVKGRSQPTHIYQLEAVKQRYTPGA